MWDRLISLHRPVGTSQEENCRDVLDLSSPTTQVYRLYTCKSTIKIKMEGYGAFFLTKPHIDCTMGLSPAGKYTHDTPPSLTCVGGFFRLPAGIPQRGCFFSISVTIFLQNWWRHCIAYAGEGGGPRAPLWCNKFLFPHHWCQGISPPDHPAKQPRHIIEGIYRAHIRSCEPICHADNYYCWLSRSNLRCNTTTPNPHIIPPIQADWIYSEDRQKRTPPN